MHLSFLRAELRLQCSVRAGLRHYVRGHPVHPMPDGRSPYWLPFFICFKCLRAGLCDTHCDEHADCHPHGNQHANCNGHPDIDADGHLDIDADANAHCDAYNHPDTTCLGRGLHQRLAMRLDVLCQRRVLQRALFRTQSSV